VRQYRCASCGQQAAEPDSSQRAPCPNCGSAGPRQYQAVLASTLSFRAVLETVKHRAPIRHRRPLGYIAAVLLAIIGFGIGSLVHSPFVGGVVAVILLVLGIIANELWATEIERYPPSEIQVKRRGRSRSDRERVEAARRQAALALGRDPVRRDSLGSPSMPTPAASRAALAVDDASIPLANGLAVDSPIAVLTIGEAAARLQLLRSQLQAMVKRRAIAALPTGFTMMIPTAEVERLRTLG
jgi:hypothetical protein